MDDDEGQLSEVRFNEDVSILADREMLPTVTLGTATPAILQRVQRFYLSVAELYERWLARNASTGTQRAYRQGVDGFIRFLGIIWPEQSDRFLRVRVADVQRFRDWMISRELAPKTINHRICAVSAFYGYLREAATELRLPINVPNPAHSQFIARGVADPVNETRALTIAQARRLKTLPDGNDIIALRDRAVLEVYLYSGIRLSAGCRLQVADFHQDEGDSRLRIVEKGDRRRIIGLHHSAAVALSEYLMAGQLTNGPLFRRQYNSRCRRLGEFSFRPQGMYLLIQSYLDQLQPRGRFTPHSIRATTATLLLGAGVEISKVQELLGHRHITTTQIYDKRRRQTSEGASHDVPV